MLFFIVIVFLGTPSFTFAFTVAFVTTILRCHDCKDASRLAFRVMLT